MIEFIVRSISEFKIGYKIDYYQREYRWKKEHIEILFNDLFLIFDEEYKKFKEIEYKEIIKIKASCYRQYYLSTFLINNRDGYLYLVDGQQRMTTISLILLNFLDLTSGGIKEFIISLIKRRDGSEKKFLIEERKEILKGIMEYKEEINNIDKEITRFFNKKLKDHDIIDITKRNMLNNYLIIKNILNKKFNADLYQDNSKLHHFIAFFLYRTILAEGQIKNDRDVPLIFEVINDRGTSLEPYEIIKGKLISKVKDNKEILNSIWIDNINKLIGQDSVSDFFIYFLNAKMENLEINMLSYDNYHKYYHKYKKELKIENEEEIRFFIEKVFPYYVNLYLKLENTIHWINHLNIKNNAIIFCLNVISFDDKKENEKINEIFDSLERYISISYLRNIINDYDPYLNEILKKINKSKLENYKELFNSALLSKIEHKLNYKPNNALENFSFVNTYLDNYDKKFLKYIFARIEDILYFINDNYFLHSSNRDIDLIYDLIEKKAVKYAFTIEHILANNKENSEFFGDSFWYIRDRMGAITLLRSHQNSSINNKKYGQKLEFYKNDKETYLNPTLFTKGIIKYKNQEIEIKEFDNLDTFTKEGIEYREKNLNKFINLLWGDL